MIMMNKTPIFTNGHRSHFLVAMFLFSFRSRSCACIHTFYPPALCILGLSFSYVFIFVIVNRVYSVVLGFGFYQKKIYIFFQLYSIERVRGLHLSVMWNVDVEGLVLVLLFGG